jgi:hypothetical protein
MIPINQMTMSTGDDLDEDDMDSDVLPTPLTFRDGELVYAWARVDWEAKAMGSCSIDISSIVSHLSSIQLS